MTVYLEAACDAARWVSAADVDGPYLYSGASGIVIFHLELYEATGDPAFRDAADAGGRRLLDALETIDAQSPCGLYDGAAGLAFAFGELAERVDPEYRSALARVTGRLQSRARRVGRGVLWNDSADVFGGTSGIGLLLLYAARGLGDPALADLAIDAGVGLVDGGHFRPAGMVNFSHGAAGVSYFLATLFRETRDVRFKSAAVAGAERLLAMADTTDGGCVIRHHEPGPDEPPLYYLGWCHGPAGVARLFYRMAQIGGEASWLDWVRRCARSIVTRGVPEMQTPGLWNNAGQCCGLAGIADFFFQLHAVSGDRSDRDFGERVARAVLARRDQVAGGLRWTHAEHRARPDDLEAQAGYMQGAAGIGAMLVHADACARGRPLSIRFPDSPW